MKKNLLKLGKISTALIVSLALGVGSGHPLFAAESTNNNTTNAGPGQNGGTPPEKPDGDSGEAPSGEMPGGEAPDGNTDKTPPAMPDGEGGSGEGGQAPGGGANTQTYDYSGTMSGALTADGEEVSSDGESIRADTADQNALLAENGGTLTVSNGSVEKSGDDDNGDNCNFYGINSIALAVGQESKMIITDTILNAISTGSNAIFSTDNATVYSKGVTITTSSDNSRGLDATYGGTILADDLDITTQGEHCASIATDRGGGFISVTNSTLSTAGSGSPLLYSTGDIEVNKVTGTATGSQIVGMEGLNTVLINNSTLSSTITKSTASDPVANGVIIYQSTSGDAETTTGDAATFQVANSTLSSSIESGAMFYITNTVANLVLSNTVLDFDSNKANLLTIAGNDANSWGSAGSNGGTVTFTALGETISGDISVDTISSLDFYLLEASTYTGAMAITENATNTNPSDAPITVNISSDSTWVLTKDTTISALNAEEGASIVDSEGKTVSIVVDGTTKISGESSLTLTVNGSYSTSLSTGEANELTADVIDRSEFDSYYGVSTAFTMTDEITSNGDDLVIVDSEEDSQEATSEVSEATSKVSEDTSKETRSDAVLGYILSGIVAVLALAGIVVGVSKKRKNRKKLEDQTKYCFSYYSP